jgi:phytoene dehydrogenase-like protein
MSAPAKVVDVIDVIIVGSGHNGLTTAAYLARAGQRVLVLEARPVLGGRAVTEEFHPGFRVSSVLHAAGPLLPAVVQELELSRHGLAWLTPEVRLYAPAPNGGLSLYDDAARTAEGLRAQSPGDADAYLNFTAACARIGRAMRAFYEPAPTLERPGPADLWRLFGLGRKLRGLPARDLHRVLRWGPMAVADLTAEWFSGELLRAAVCARGIYATNHGPRAPGSSVGLLLQAALDGQATAPAHVPRGGMGAITAALASAARSFGAEIRAGAKVAEITVANGRAAGVVLTSGEEIRARVVVSDVDPRTTFLSLVDAAALGPAFVTKIRNIRARGSAAKLNLALSRLPRFGNATRGQLTGRIHVGPTVDSLERAADAIKYGEISAEPTLDVTVPSLLDPSLCPNGAQVVSIHAQFAPHTLRAGDWSTRRQELYATIVQTLAQHAPDLPATIVGHHLLTPQDLEREYGLSGGHLFHGEPSLDQLYTFRPLLGWAGHRTPIAGLYLCGSGTHPGGPVTGAPGRNASRVVLEELR